ncbi:hypothetical protein RQP46_006318 [Phenoliferia psychrophenolica]
MAESRKGFKSDSSSDDAPAPASTDMHARAAELAEEKGGISSEKTEALSLDEARQLIEEFCAGRELDPNFDQDLLKRARDILRQDDLNEESVAALVEEIKLEAALMEDSPYLEVRSAVSMTDDPTEPVNTFRAWYFVFLSKMTPPKTEAPSPRRFIGFVFVSIGTGVNNQILLTLSTQMLGFGLAGMGRRFLINPPSMIWPAALATVALNRSFHEPGLNPTVSGWKISRLRFFTIVFVIYGLYFVLPQAVFSALSYFNWITWISPNNIKLALIAGSVGGIGLSPIATLDWSYIQAINNPLISPLYSSLNLAAGLCFMAICLICPLYFTNTWYSAYMPINSASLYDNTGNVYNISRVLTHDYRLDEAAYAAYGPAYQTTGNAVAFFSYFALYPATLVHVFLYNRKEVWTGFRAVFAGRSTRDYYNDTHNKLMRAYKEVPEWWFSIILILSIVFGCIYNEVYATQFPIWAIFFTVALGMIFLIPCGVIQALTNSSVTLNVVGEIIASYTIPNRPVANMIFKDYAFTSTAQAVQYLSDLKIAHYARLPPRSVFAIQMLASVWACFVSDGVVDWQLKNISNLCQSDQVDGFTCPSYTVYENSAVQFGAIGAQRLYSHGALYYPMVYGFLVGAIAPIPFYFLARRWPAWRLVNMPVFFNGGGWLAPYNISYVSMSSYIAIFFMGYMKKRHTGWWSKYNYILATALTSAVSIFGVIWFFAILYKGYDPVWWGNTVPFAGADGDGTPLLAMPAVGYFGPP